MMKTAIFGCGCIGGLLAARLRRVGAPVSVFDRDETRRVIRSEGIALTEIDGTTYRVDGFDVPSSIENAGPADIVFLGLKAHQIPDALDSLARLMDSDTTLVTVQNGIPWWYFQGSDSSLEPPVIEAVDPGGRISAVVNPAQIVGCVAYPAATRPAPGHIVHVEGDRMPVGPVVATQTERAEMISDLLSEAGFRSHLLEDLRGEIWLKAVGTASLNPISALTRATFSEICADPATREIARLLMEEAAAVAAALGIELRVSIGRRLEGAERVGHHRSSMLQDVEREERMEVDALVTAIAELADRMAVDTPNLRQILALLRLLDATSCRGG